MYAPQSPMEPSLNIKTSRLNTDIGISILPDETLHKIFVLFSDMSPASNQALCSVSRRWRGVALAYSDLWRIVSCDVDRRFPPTLKLWVKRSHRALVKICVISCPETRKRADKWRE